MRTLEQLAVRVKVLHPTDSIGKAAEAIRCSTVGAVPVIQDGMLCGLLTASLLAEWLAEHGPEWAPERMKEQPVSCVSLEPAPILPESLPPAEALRYFRENGVERAPVLDVRGGLVGMVSTAELVSAVCGRVRPPVIGGMATPFGVYLTGGGARGGVGDFALMTTGIFMAVLNLLALVAATLVLAPGGWAYSWPGVGAWLQHAHPAGLAQGATWFLFALLFRLSWVTGFHAAEHQVVHAVEAGDDLRPEIVAQKPRVHPRCGTNLVTAVMLMVGIVQLGKEPLSASVDTMIPVAMVLTLFLWRRVGGFLQQYVTTRPATRKQIENGIAAAEQLMARYQERPDPALNLRQRIWNMGLLQVLAGWVVVLGAWALLQLVFPIPEAFRLSLV